MGEKDLDGIVEGQPLRLRLLRRLLEAAGDPDREFLRDAGRATSRHPISVAKDSAYLRRAATMAPGQPALGARAKVGAQL